MDKEFKQYNKIPIVCPANPFGEYIPIEVDFSHFGKNAFINLNEISFIFKIEMLNYNTEDMFKYISPLSWFNSYELKLAFLDENEKIKHINFRSSLGTNRGFFGNILKCLDDNSIEFTETCNKKFFDIEVPLKYLVDIALSNKSLYHIKKFMLILHVKDFDNIFSSYLQDLSARVKSCMMSACTYYNYPKLSLIPALIPSGDTKIISSYIIKVSGTDINIWLQGCPGSSGYLQHIMYFFVAEDYFTPDICNIVPDTDVSILKNDLFTPVSSSPGHYIKDNVDNSKNIDNKKHYEEFLNVSKKIFKRNHIIGYDTWYNKLRIYCMDFNVHHKNTAGTLHLELNKPFEKKNVYLFVNAFYTLYSL